MTVTIHTGDCRVILPTLAANSVHTVVTSPPYFGLRDYGTARWRGGDPDCRHQQGRPGSPRANGKVDGRWLRNRDGVGAMGGDCRHCGAKRIDRQIGLEPTPDAYVAELVAVFREVRRVLRDDGTVWLNLGSSYVSHDSVANQSRQRKRVPAYGNDGRAPASSPAVGFACHDLGDAHQAGLSSRRGRIADNGLRPAQTPLRHGPRGRDSGPRDLAEASTDFSPLGVPVSNTRASSRRGGAAADHVTKALVSPLSRQSSAADDPRFVDTSVCTFDIESPLGALDQRRLDKPSSGLACDCGSCGICWAYLAIPLLRFKTKDAMSIPWLVALALQADGWYLRQDIIWAKPNPMPESVTDRCTKSHEYLFLLSKRERYYYDQNAIAEPATYHGLANQDDSGFKDPRLFNGKHQNGYRSSGRLVINEATRKDLRSEIESRHRSSIPGGQSLQTKPTGKRNKRSVWTVATEPYEGAHFATFPPALIEPCILAGCPAGGTVLDPFAGTGVTGIVADQHGCNAVLIELNPRYATMAKRRVHDTAPLLTEVAMAPPTRPPRQKL